MLNLASPTCTKLYYAMLLIANCVSKVGHLQRIFLVLGVALLKSSYLIIVNFSGGERRLLKIFSKRDAFLENGKNMFL